MAGPVEAPNTLTSVSTIRIVDLIGEGTIAGMWPVSGISGQNPLCSIYFDDVPILDGDGTPNFNTTGGGFLFAFNSGTSGQQPLAGFETLETLIPLPLNTRVANPPPNNGYPKTVISSFNTSMYPDAESVKITLRFPAVYTVDQSNGNTNGFNITWAVDISTNNGAFVEVDQMNLTDITSSPKCISPFYFTKVYTLPKPAIGAMFYEWKVRVRRVSQNILSSNTANDMFVEAMAVVASNTYRYPMSAVVGIQLTADQFAGAPSRAYDVKGITVRVPEGYTATQYNVDGTITAATYPSVWDGTFSATRQWTDNPAWIFYDLVTNKRYGLGGYIRAEWVDKWTLYQIAQYCDEMVDDGAGGLEPRFACNVAIADTQDAYTLLNNLVSVFQGMLYWSNGRIFPVGSETRGAVFNFSNANVVNGVFNYADTPRTTRSTVCIVKWRDPDNLFRPTPERLEDINGITKYGYIEKNIEAFATTSRGQAMRAANWLLTVEQLLTETITFQTDAEGLYLRPGDVFNVYDNYRNNKSQGGRIVNWGTGQQSIVLDKEVELQAGFSYTFSAIVPAASLIGTGDISDSDQIGFIRNSQIETRSVISVATPSTNVLELNSGFYGDLYKGSVWILNGSGDSVTVFDQASQYKCLVASEPANGVVEVLGVQYNTGINYRVNNNYSVESNPAVIGDMIAPNAPTGITATRVTGLEINNVFFDYTNISWTASTSTNAVYYTLSGQLNAGTPYIIAQPRGTFVNYTPPLEGTYTFSVAANNGNGIQSAFNRVDYVLADVNPLGVTAPLSGIYIARNWDPYYIRSSDGEYTGYVGTAPAFGWHVTLDNNGNPVPSAQFITGYRVRLLELGNESNVLSLSDISVSGRDNTTWALNADYLYTGTSVKPLRGFTVSVDTVDVYYNVVSGARLAVNNPQLPAPINSGFVGYNGGMTYNITPRASADISGVYLWTNASPSFTPTFDNVTLTSTNFAGTVDGPQQGNIYTWFSLFDTYGFSGSLASAGDSNAIIYGPISGNANQMFQTFEFDITDQLSGAFALLTGMITDSISIVSGDALLALQTVNGLSGQITGLGDIPGAVNTALNVRVNTAVVSSSGSLSSQIDAVSARVIQTGIDNYALAGVVMDALATTGGALSSWITNLGASTTGVTAAIQIGAQAFVTGSVNGIGGVAVATWGLKLDANGKVVSMQATSNSFPGSYGTIVFGNANLQSNTFTAGSAGWQISADGNAEFNNASIRGAFTGGSAPDLVVMDSDGFMLGTPGGDRVEIIAPSFRRAQSFYNSANSPTVSLGNFDDPSGPIDIGLINVFNTAGAASIILNGKFGNADLAGTGVLGGISIFSRTSPTAIMRQDGLISGNSFLDLGGNSAILGDASKFGGIRYSGGTTNVIGFWWDGSNVRVMVDGTLQGTIPNP